MNWLDRLNRRFGRFGIPYLMNAILIGQAAVWFVTMFVNARVYSLLTLNLAGLQHLQLWRLVSFVFVPPLTTSWATRWNMPGAISASPCSGWWA